MFYFNPKGIIIPDVSRINEYVTEEGVDVLKVSFDWGTATYSVDSANSIQKTIRVFDTHMMIDLDGRAYRPGTITKKILSVDEFTDEYSRLCRMYVEDIREVMQGTN